MAMPLSETTRFAMAEAGRFLAHVNTLSAGSIVVIATFAEKFRGQAPGWLLAASVIGFAIAIAAGIACSALVLALIDDDEPDPTTQLIATVAYVATACSFWAALAFLAAFAALAVT